jgi:hypothetical protein
LLCRDIAWCHRWPCSLFNPPAASRGVASLERLTQLPLRTLSIACILSREAADGGPIEGVPALSEEPQKSIMQQASKRHRYAQTLGRFQREADVLVSERRGESCRLVLAFRDLSVTPVVRIFAGVP